MKKLLFLVLFALGMSAKASNPVYDIHVTDPAIIFPLDSSIRITFKLSVIVPLEVTLYFDSEHKLVFKDGIINISFIDKPHEPRVGSNEAFFKPALSGIKYYYVFKNTYTGEIYAQGETGPMPGVLVKNSFLGPRVSNITHKSGLFEWFQNGNVPTWVKIELSSPDFTDVWYVNINVNEITEDKYFGKTIQFSEFDSNFDFANKNLIFRIMSDIDTSESLSFEATYVGLNPISNSHFAIYPNPSNGTFYIQSENSGIYQIFDVCGKEISASAFTSGEKINLNLPTGMYTVKVNNNSFSKFIIN